MVYKKYIEQNKGLSEGGMDIEVDRQQGRRRCARADGCNSVTRSADVLIQSLGLLTSFTISPITPLEPLLVDIAGIENLINVLERW